MSKDVVADEVDLTFEPVLDEDAVFDSGTDSDFDERMLDFEYELAEFENRMMVDEESDMMSWFEFVTQFVRTEPDEYDWITFDDDVLDDDTRNHRRGSRFVLWHKRLNGKPKFRNGRPMLSRRERHPNNRDRSDKAEGGKFNITKRRVRDARETLEQLNDYERLNIMVQEAPVSYWTPRTVAGLPSYVNDVGNRVFVHTQRLNIPFVRLKTERTRHMDKDAFHIHPHAARWTLQTPRG